MGEVVSLQAQREKNSPHLEGPTLCLACGHKTHGVAPVGVTWMECSECHAMKCIFSNPVVCADPVWHCNCGNIFFTMNKFTSQCSNCGLDISF